MTASVITSSIAPRRHHESRQPLQSVPDQVGRNQRNCSRNRRPDRRDGPSTKAARRAGRTTSGRYSNDTEARSSRRRRRRTPTEEGRSDGRGCSFGAVAGSRRSRGISPPVVVRLAAPAARSPREGRGRRRSTRFKKRRIHPIVTCSGRRPATKMRGAFARSRVGEPATSSRIDEEWSVEEWVDVIGHGVGEDRRDTGTAAARRPRCQSIAFDGG